MQAASSTGRKSASKEPKSKAKTFLYEGLEIELPKQPLTAFMRFFKENN